MKWSTYQGAEGASRIHDTLCVLVGEHLGEVGKDGVRGGAVDQGHDPHLPQVMLSQGPKDVGCIPGHSGVKWSIKTNYEHEQFEHEVSNCMELWIPIYRVAQK